MGDVFEAGVIVSAPDVGATALSITVTATVTPSSTSAPGDAGDADSAGDANATTGGNSTTTEGARKRNLLQSEENTNSSAPGAGKQQGIQQQQQQQSLAIQLLPEDPYSRTTALNSAKQQREVRFLWGGQGQKFRMPEVFPLGLPPKGVA